MSLPQCHLLLEKKMTYTYHKVVNSSFKYRAHFDMKSSIHCRYKCLGGGPLFQDSEGTITNMMTGY